MSLSLVLIFALFMCCSAQDCGQFTTSDQEGPFFVPGVPNNYRQTCKRCFTRFGMKSTIVREGSYYQIISFCYTHWRSWPHFVWGRGARIY